jgi:hypothetical protein
LIALCTGTGPKGLAPKVFALSLTAADKTIRGAQVKFWVIDVNY